MAAITKRTILHTLSIMRDPNDLLNALNKLFAVISLDFVKAFHRVDWDSIFSSLSKFG